MTRTLDVWWDRRLVGQLTQNEHGELGFAYAPEWVSDDTAHPLSASLPKRTEPFKRRECRPFFGGLLPEEGQRDAAAQALGISRSNDFALLDRLGGDVEGALQLLPPLYDLLATVAYPDLASKFATQIGKRAKLSELDEKGWSAFAADAGLGLPLVRRRVAETSERAILQANVADDELVQLSLDDKALMQFAAMVVDRTERCAHSTRGNGLAANRQRSR